MTKKYRYTSLYIGIISGEKMKYYIKNINEFSEEKQKEYLLFLDEDKLSQFNLTTNKNRKKSLLISHGFLKEKVSEEYNINIGDLVFSVTESGKPYCKSHNDIHFSISHSGDFIAVATSKKDVGIDIELMKNPTEKLIDRVCCENEKSFINSNENKEKAFTEIWTKKEAYLKALGTGIDRELKTVDTTKLEFVTEYSDDFIVSVFCL